MAGAFFDLISFGDFSSVVSASPVVRVVAATKATASLLPSRSCRAAAAAHDDDGDGCGCGGFECWSGWRLLMCELDCVF